MIGEHSWSQINIGWGGSHVGGSTAVNHDTL